MFQDRGMDFIKNKHKNLKLIWVQSKLRPFVIFWSLHCCLSMFWFSYQYVTKQNYRVIGQNAVKTKRFQTWNGQNLSNYLDQELAVKISNLIVKVQKLNFIVLYFFDSHFFGFLWNIATSSSYDEKKSFHKRDPTIQQVEGSHKTV